MVILEKTFGCISPQIGSYISTIMLLGINIYLTVNDFQKMDLLEEWIALKIVTLLSLIWDFICLVFNIGLFVSLIKKHTKFMRIWKWFCLVSMHMLGLTYIVKSIAAKKHGVAGQLAGFIVLKGSLRISMLIYFLMVICSYRVQIDNEEYDRYLEKYPELVAKFEMETRTNADKNSIR